MTDAAYILDVSSAQAPGRAPGRASLQDDLDWAWAAPARPRAMTAAMMGFVFFTECSW